MNMIDFKVIAMVKGLGGEKRKKENIIASNPVEARELAQKRFPRAKELLLYQLLGKGEKPECFGAEYNKSWSFGRGWGNGTEWLRITPGKAQPLSFAPDEATDKELTEKYLQSLHK